MRSALAILLGGLAVLGGVAFLHTPAPEPQVAVVAVPPPPPPDPDITTVGVRIQRGSTLGHLLGDYQVSAHAVREAALAHYDLARIRPDRELQLVYVDGEQDPVALRYTIDEDHAVVVERRGDSWTAHVDEVVYDSEVAALSFALERSLWLDGLDAGLRPADLVTLGQIFEYELDFNSELRAGARFALVADQLTAPGKKPKLGRVHAARIHNGDRSYTAVLHTLSDGSEDYFHPDGTGMKRPFLRSPLEFSRVTSGFNPRRFHPILKRARPHNGTDFGAPTGTPVRAVADGVVVFAGRSGGHGNHVKLDHEGPYDTSYSHLSRIRVKRGAHVRQGQIIGEVGSTGMSTAPHLHYQMWRNGKYVDAMKIDLPNSMPLPASERAAFDETASTWLPYLEAVPQDPGQP